MRLRAFDHFAGRKSRQCRHAKVDADDRLGLWIMGCTSLVSTIRDTNQRPASRETVARLSGPENRTASRIRTQPITGSLIRSPSARNVPTSLAAQNEARSSLRLNLRILAALFEKRPESRA